MTKGTSSDRISALVILPARSGKQIDARSDIRAENIADYEFDPVNAAAVASAFTEAGFTAGTAIGISLPISGTPAQFAEFFDTEVAVQADGGWLARTANDEWTAEMPTASIPPSLAERIVTVTFEPPSELHV